MQRLRQLFDKLSDGWVIAILTLIGAVAISVSLGIHIADAQDQNWWGWIDSLTQNLGAGIIGALITFLLIDRIIGGRELRNRLIREMGSDVHDIAVQAVNELRAHGWLMDGSLNKVKLLHARLEGANLSRACLHGADLRWANLQGANLEHADLQKADLRHAELQEANLLEASLQEATSENANLQKVDLTRAKLQRANLRYTNLQNANLLNANLQGTDFFGADLVEAYMSSMFSEDTILPSGGHWPEESPVRFTDPDHPNFWHRSGD